jgi:hypothetical protein
MIRLGRPRRLFGGLDSVSVIGTLLLVIEISLWWCGRFAPRVDIACGDSDLRRVVVGDRRVAGLEIERDTVPSKPCFEIGDPLLVGVKLRLLALHLGRLMEGGMSAEALDLRPILAREIGLAETLRQASMTGFVRG